MPAVPPSPDDHTPGQARSGDRVDEFTAFAERSADRLHRLAWLRGASSADAEDAVQHCFLVMYDRWHAINDPDAYATRTVLNFISRRRRAVDRLIPLDAVAEQTYGVSDESVDDLENDEFIGGLLSALPAKQREVVEGLLCGLDYRQLEKTTGRSYDALRRNLSDARKNIALELRRQWGQPNENGEEGQ